mgnify:CR=1 FL=1
MGLKSEDLRPIFDEVLSDYSVVYDIGVTTPPDYLIRQRVQDYSDPDYKSNPSYGQSFSLDESCKSIIVWNIFSIVAFDYTFRDVFIPQILHKLNLRYNTENYFFGYDDYKLNRKQFAVRSGTAKISRPSIAFHEKFGLNYKIDLLFTNASFEDSVIVDDMLQYENCIGCDAPCESSCPVGCKFNFEHSDWRKCDNFISRPELFANPDNMCRICQDACPYSEELKQKLLEINPNYGRRLN